MKTRRLAQIVGILVGGLAIVGLLVGDKHLFEFINVDIALDMLRFPIAAALLYAGFWAKDNLTVHNIVLGVGLPYVGMGVLGLLSPDLFGLLPHGLTGFDVTFHIVTGIIAVLAGLMHREHHQTAEPV